MEKSFTDWWKSLSPTEKDEAAITISRNCNAALSTVSAWGLGYRTPKARSQKIIADFLKEKGVESAECKTLFP